MSVRQSIIEKRNEAVKQNLLTKNMLKVLYANLQNKEIELKREVNEKEAEALVRKFVNECNEELEGINLSILRGTSTTVMIERKAMLESLVSTLSELLPKPLTEEEVVALIDGIIADVKAKGLPVAVRSVMPLVQKKISGVFDGKQAGVLVQQRLSQLEG